MEIRTYPITLQSLWRRPFGHEDNDAPGSPIVQALPTDPHSNNSHRGSTHHPASGRPHAPYSSGLSSAGTPASQAAERKQPRVPAAGCANAFATPARRQSSEAYVPFEQYTGKDEFTGKHGVTDI